MTHTSRTPGRGIPPPCRARPEGYPPARGPRPRGPVRAPRTPRGPLEGASRRQSSRPESGRCPLGAGIRCWSRRPCLGVSPGRKQGDLSVARARRARANLPIDELVLAPVLGKPEEVLVRDPWTSRSHPTSIRPPLVSSRSAGGAGGVLTRRRAPLVIDRPLELPGGRSNPTEPPAS